MSGQLPPEDASGPHASRIADPGGALADARTEDPFLAFASESDSGAPHPQVGPPTARGAGDQLVIFEAPVSHDGTFASEQLPLAVSPATPDVPRSWGRVVGVIIVAALAVAGGAAGFFQLSPLREPDSATIPLGTLPRTAAPADVVESTAHIDSRPPGALVIIDGVVRGVTPLSLSLPVGDHALELEQGSVSRSLALRIEAGTTASQYVELDSAVSAVTTGHVDVSSTPAGARVSLDGAPRGVTPLRLDAVAPGPHTIVVSNDEEVITRAVTVTAGATTPVVVALAAGPSLVGWVSIAVPVEMRVLEGGRFLGTTRSARIALIEGRHDLELVSADLGFQSFASVQITRNRVSNASIQIPNGKLLITAVPWADVTLDGRSLGGTPLNAMSVPIGPHEVIWRHPQFGERRQTLLVTTSGQARATVDFTK